MSIKEGDGEKVEEMRGREKLVRTPQQVFVFLLYLSSHVFVFVSGWCICICIILVYLYLYQVGVFVFVLSPKSSSQPLCSQGNNKGLGCCGGLASFLAWIWEDFKMRHLVTACIQINVSKYQNINICKHIQIPNKPLSKYLGRI